MNNLQRIQATLTRHRNSLMRAYNLKEIGVFGSVVHGNQRAESDVDILVSFSRPVDLFTFLEIEEKLGHLLHAKVDLVSKNALKPAIGKRILREVVYA